jgi:hypothetical protein
VTLAVAGRDRHERGRSDNVQNVCHFSTDDMSRRKEINELINS